MCSFKATVRYHYISIRMTKVENTGNTKSWWICEVTETVFYYWWKCKMVHPLGRQLGSFLQNWTYLYQVSSNFAPWCLHKGIENLCPHKKIPTNIYSSFIQIAKACKKPRCPSGGERISCYASRIWNISSV